MNFIEKMRNSNVQLLESEAADLEKWSKICSSSRKEDFELFLNHNIAEITFRTKKLEERTIVCTSNTILIKIFSLAKDADKRKVASLISEGIHTHNPESILTWDLQANHYKTVYLLDWKINNFVSITPDNILILDAIVKNLLKKKC